MSATLLSRATRAVAFLGLALVLTDARAFGFDDVARRAADLAGVPYKKPDTDLPKALAALNYDQYRDIRYKPDKAVWRAQKLPFELAFFHQGLYYTQPVRVNEVVGSVVREIRFSPELFDYGANRIDPQQLKGLGFAGFRVHYPINTPKYKDEVLVFLGASYFKALGKGQVYGMSARGLAVDTALMSGEEFPYFSEFWVHRPEPNARELVIDALLDSRRMTGAYRFVLKPGVETAVEVRTRLFLRENVSKLGIAPLTTMYFYGENQRGAREDFRPEVHDSDGLSIRAGTGEWIWRPFINPKKLLVSSFALTNPVGFGIQQRDRNFDHYEDLEARYDKRPSVWIEPRDPWGRGRVELVQIPTPDETNDNIVAYWVPDDPPAVREGYDLQYRLLWQKDTETRPPQSWVVQTRRGSGYTRNPDNSIGFVIDFDGPALKKLPAEAELVGVVSNDGNAEVLERRLERNEVSGGWRLILKLRRLDDNKPVELRAFLRSEQNALSETWSYLLPPG